MGIFEGEDINLRCGRIGNDAGVQCHHTELKLLRHPCCPEKTLRKDIGSKSNIAIIGYRQCFFFRLEGEHGGDGAEDLLFADAHVTGNVAQYSCVVEVWSCNVVSTLIIKTSNWRSSLTQICPLLSSDLDPSSLLYALFDEAMYSLGGGWSDQWPMSRSVVASGANDELLNRYLHSLQELRVYARMHHYTIRAHASLPGRLEFARDDCIDRNVEVCIVEHDERSIATKFEAQFFQRGA